MKIKNYMLFFSFLISHNLFSQNIVPNYSFENDTACPYSGSELYYAIPWHTSTAGTPDYYNACAGSTVISMGVPQNWSGNQNAKTGVAYAGAYFYGVNSTSDTTEWKEYLQVKLLDTLLQGKIYCVKFYVNFAKPTLQAYNNVAITEIGMYISNDSISLNTDKTLPYTPQIKSSVNVFLNDTVNWSLISGQYIAVGGEKYITIGNFKAHTDTLGVVNHINYSASYYFVDDVSLVDCTDAGVQELSDVNEINIYPNPTTSLFTIHSEGMKIKEIKITNTLGQQIKTIHNTETIDISNLPNGIYFAEIKTEKGITCKKIIKQ